MNFMVIFHFSAKRPIEFVILVKYVYLMEIKTKDGK